MIDQKKAYDDFYKNCGASAHTDPVRFTAIAKLCKGRVLDLACGTGDLADFFDGEYFGVDVSDVGIDLAKQVRRKDAKFIVGDVLDQNALYHEHFDTIVIGEFLEHIPDDEKLFEKLLTLLNKDGRIIVSVPNGNRIPDPNHVREFTVPQIRAKYKKYGRLQFHNFDGFAGRILFSIELNKKNDDLLSLCMVVKNEGKGLETAVLSCIDFVDEIVLLVDSNSNDNTLDIAKRYGDIAQLYEWKNSFCQARNEAQKFVKTKWVLILDGHEYCTGTPPALTDLNKDVDGLFCNIEMEDKTRIVFTRILRKEIEWKSAVHNYPATKTTSILPNFTLVHDRDHLQSEEATKLRAKQRTEMIFSILTANIKKDPKDTRSLFYLGQECIMESRWKEAIYWYKRYLKISRFVGERYNALYSLGLAHAQLGHKYRALWTYIRLDREMPGRWQSHKRIGAVLMWLGFYKTALPELVEALGNTKGVFTFDPEQKDDAQTWDMIGQCFFNLREYQKAKIAWQRCIELSKGKTPNSDFFERLKMLEQLMKGI